VVAEDISERKRAEATLAEREQQFRTLANSIPQLAWMADPDGWIFWYNERWYEYTGATPQEMEGWGWQSLHDPTVLPDVLARFKASLATGEPFDMTFPLKGADGAFRPFLTRMMPIRDSHGHIVRWFGTNTDITAQKEHEAHLNFVMRELSHRSKNLLAVVQAMARQTMQHSGDFHDFEGRFMGRLHGLARSHDLLVREDWAGASIRDLVGAQLAPFVREEGASLDISGPDLVLRPDAVQNLGFALFELATNAVKYGALAARNGKVAIHWDLVDAQDGQRVRLKWSESGGPRVKQPERKGFGSVVIERFMAAAFGGKVESGFAPEGFTWSLEIPAEHLLSEVGGARSPAPSRNALQ
jgi:PAS domain S-box-containing protein